jgi:hypothetical protein
MLKAKIIFVLILISPDFSFYCNYIKKDGQINLPVLKDLTPYYTEINLESLLTMYSLSCPYVLISYGKRMRKKHF